jgi:hypothetical protein
MCVTEQFVRALFILQLIYCIFTSFLALYIHKQYSYRSSLHVCWSKKFIYWSLRIMPLSSAVGTAKWLHSKDGESMYISVLVNLCFYCSFDFRLVFKCVWHRTVWWGIVPNCGFSPWRHRFTLKVFHVWFVVDKVTLGHVFLQVLWFSPVSFYSTNAAYLYSYICHWYCGY